MTCFAIGNTICQVSELMIALFLHLILYQEMKLTTTVTKVNKQVQRTRVASAIQYILYCRTCFFFDPPRTSVTLQMYVVYDKLEQAVGEEDTLPL